MNNHLFIGKLGEDLACRFLEEKGFKILERNYWKKWGELDIVSEKDRVTHFVEVKAVSQKINDGQQKSVIHETQRQPEDAVHPWKVRRLSRTINSYLSEKGIEEKDWKFGIVAVFIDQEKKIARIRYTENILI